MSNPINYRFSFGPWNISEGADPFGPEVRAAFPHEKKFALYRELGFEGVQLHDDDVVPGLDGLTPAQMLAKAGEVKRVLDGEGLTPEFVAPRLWFAEQTVDGGYTSNSASDRAYAWERTQKCIDIARALGCRAIVLWLSREGTYIREAKDARLAYERLQKVVDAMLDHDSEIEVWIEPKPNEPMDHAYLPTTGHALAIAQLTKDSKRVGCVIESAHAILAGLDPADEIDFAMSFGKLWSLHLNDQNGLKFDQDKPFGSANLRVAFNQIRALERNGYGKKGEFVCFDVHPFRTTSEKQWLSHLSNSRRTFEHLLAKAKSYPEKEAAQLIAARNYQDLDQLVIEHLLGVL